MSRATKIDYLLVGASLAIIGLFGCAQDSGLKNMSKSRIEMSGVQSKDTTILNEKKEANSGDTTSSDSQDEEAAIKAYELTVYPLAKQYCGSCHAGNVAPHHASADVKEAYHSVVDNKKVDFVDTANSRLVLRLSKDAHYCWGECSKAAEEMDGKIKEWLSKIKKDENPDDKKDDVKVIATSPLTMADTKEILNYNPNPENTFAFEAEDAVVAGPMEIIDSVLVPSKKVARSATANAGTLTFNFEVKKAGTFRVIGRARGPTANQRTFTSSMDNGAATTWQIANDANSFQYSIADTDNNPANGGVFTFALQPGQHSVRVGGGQVNAELDSLVITDNPTYTGNEARIISPKAKILSFDLSEHLNGEKARFEIEITQHTDKSYRFRYPRIVTAASPVKIKGIKLFVNDKTSEQIKTYSYVNKIVKANTDELLEVTEMTAAYESIDPSADKFHFTFDALEIAK